MSTKPSTSYLFDRNPTFYGGQQKDYLDRAERAINECVEGIAKGLETKSPSEIFFTVWPTLCARRHQIALEHRTEDAEDFGTRRLSSSISFPKGTNTEGRSGYISSFTPLGSQYLEYNKKFLVQVQDFIKPMQRTLREFETQEIKEVSTVPNLRSSSFTATVFSCLEKVGVPDRDLPDSGRKKHKLLPETSIFSLKWDRFVSTEELQKALDCTDSNYAIFCNPILMQKLKTEHPALYIRHTMSVMVRQLISDYPSSAQSPMGHRNNLKSLYFLGVLRLEIDGQMCAIGRFLTWLYQDLKQDPVDRMVERSIALVIHQDPFLIDSTLVDIAKIFASALEWDRSKEDLQTLKNRVALLRFAYAYCMPCLRGDGAIGDWLELSIYRHHGFLRTRHNDNTLPCFEPLSSISLENYIKTYDRTINIE